MSLIQEVRNIVGIQYTGNSQRDEAFDVIDDLKWEGTLVDYTFEDGGRWSNYKTHVYKLVEGDEIAYFEVYQKVPATELQEGGNFSVEVNEVEPYIVSVTKYRHKKEELK